MATRRVIKRKRSAAHAAPPVKVRGDATSRRASLFRNGANQAVRLPQDLRFPGDISEVQIRKQGDSLVISPVKPDWSTFFATQVAVPEDFLSQRDQSPPQEREEP